MVVELEMEMEMVLVVPRGQLGGVVGVCLWFFLSHKPAFLSRNCCGSFWKWCGYLRYLGC